MSSDTDFTRSFAEGVVARLRNAGHQALFAGGCVRDLLRGETPQDFDVATSARPEEVREIFGQRRTLAVGASFGVIVVLPSKAERDAGVLPVEVATFRTEGRYLDGRRPENVSFADAKADAKRRDFTINGMFLDPVENRVIDYVGGQADLSAGIVRAIGDPRERMAEDKLRLLRAVRFAAMLGFELEVQTFSAVREMASQLTVVSAERIAQELRRMLLHTHRRRAIELCADSGLLEVIVPELKGTLVRVDVSAKSLWQQTLHALERLDRPRFESALVVLLHAISDQRHDFVDNLCRRLKLSNAERESAVWLSEHRHDFDEIQQRPRWLLKRLCANPDIHDLVSVARTLATAKLQPLADVEYVARFLAETPPERIDPPALLDGSDLIRMGLKPGPEFKRLLDAVRNAQLDETINTHEAAIDLARRLHAEGAADTT